MALPLLLGRTTDGTSIVRSLADLPHLLVAGLGGSGKTVCLRAIITSLVSAASPGELKLILVETHHRDLAGFSDVPHLWTPPVVDAGKAGLILAWLEREMRERYDTLGNAGARSIADFNQRNQDRPMPYVVMVVEELADLLVTDEKEIQRSIVRMVQQGHGVGIHLILATRRPADVFPESLRSNIPSRIAFRVLSGIESRILLDRTGAEHLSGKGDMLIKLIDQTGLLRAQGTFVSDDEVHNLVKRLRAQGKPDYHPELIDPQPPQDLEDELFDEAVELVLREGHASTALIQRAFSVGYSRAALLIQAMHNKGIVGPHRGSKPREILLTLDEWNARHRKPPPP